MLHQKSWPPWGKEKIYEVWIYFFPDGSFFSSFWIISGRQKEHLRPMQERPHCLQSEPTLSLSSLSCISGLFGVSFMSSYFWLFWGVFCKICLRLSKHLLDLVHLTRLALTSSCFWSLSHCMIPMIRRAVLCLLYTRSLRYIKFVLLQSPMDYLCLWVCTVWLADFRSNKDVWRHMKI